MVFMKLLTTEYLLYLSVKVIVTFSNMIGVISYILLKDVITKSQSFTGINYLCTEHEICLESHVIWNVVQ